MIFSYLEARLGEDWLIGYDSQEFFALAHQVSQRLKPSTATPPTILLAERHPVKFLAYFMGACSTPCTIALANPDWGTTEWHQVLELVQPDLIWGEGGKTAEGRKAGARSQKPEARSQKLLKIQNSNLKIQNSKFKIQNSFSSPLILIPTGGTSGKIRFAAHTWETLMASVQGFQHYFGVHQIHSFCVLPPYHVSGLMQFLRSFTSGGKLILQPFKSIEGGDFGTVDPKDFFLSLVPTQLQRLLSPEKNFPQSPSPVTWLSQFKTVLLGGAPAWPGLLEMARQHQIRLAPTYGMTETASQIVTLKPEDFLRGINSCGQVLPHAQVTICDPEGNRLGSNQTGRITIQAKSLCLGYCLAGDGSDNANLKESLSNSINIQFQKGIFQPDDLGFFDSQGYLHIIGRSSDKIITGGENVFPAEVEAAIRMTGLIRDVCVMGVSDRHWGEAVCALYIPINPTVSSIKIQAALIDKLSKFKCPKHWIVVESLPRNLQGKIDRRQAKRMIELKIRAEN
ncbi:2-succinylbenzoate--CoA ligase [Kovacikia minuta CCNUW1]|uniref:2-succinylbenzoate--CoA ligase n=1 Tax=Kovacikia minuta TaxID=2931930 RepID=UPI001CCCDBE5|nr:2-succinylbenzoate--CoA ligase [Kovacikia minuta]UBF24887.1 2-succinylbenzoate--CoA ligase [Kovacikia minuta CCNUW1]